MPGARALDLFGRPASVAFGHMPDPPAIGFLHLQARLFEVHTVQDGDGLHRGGALARIVVLVAMVVAAEQDLRCSGHAGSLRTSSAAVKCYGTSVSFTHEARRRFTCMGLA